MNRHELHFHTAEQVAQHLDDALAILQARELPLELQAAALPQLIALLAGKQITEDVPMRVPMPPLLGNNGRPI